MNLISALPLPARIGGPAPFCDIMLIPDFLSPMGRQHIEGQVYAYGNDICTVYQTSKTPYGKGEINIDNADQQVPVLNSLARELKDWLRLSFEWQLQDLSCQLRQMQPGYAGHPRHVDYAKGYDTPNGIADEVLTSVSLSLPISDHTGTIPAFHLFRKDGGTVKQQHARTLVLFGPQVEHEHPPTQSLDEPFLWLVVQAFFNAPAP